MRFYRCLAILLLVLLLILFGIGVASAQDPPSVTTDAAGDVTSNSATLNGTLTALGNASSVDVSFEWGLTTSYGNETTPQTLTGTGAFNDNIGGLDPGVTYHYRAKAVGNGTAYGGDVSFTTSTSAPTVSTEAATGVESTSAILVGDLTDLGTAGSVDVSFEWGLTASYGNETTPQTRTSIGTFSEGITGIAPDTTYHFRAKAVGDGTAYGDDFSFTTPGSIELEGWVWCTCYGSILDATFDGYVTTVGRSHASPGGSIHVAGNLTVIRPDATDLIVNLDMYGSKIRSLFYMSQEATGISANFSGSWIEAESGDDYMYTSGWVALPNPEGEVFKTAKICFVVLRTPDVDVPLADGGNFLEDMEALITRVVNFFDKLLDSLIGTGFREAVSGILSKTMVRISVIRDGLGGSYFP